MYFFTGQISVFDFIKLIQGHSSYCELNKKLQLADKRRFFKNNRDAALHRSDKNQQNIEIHH